MNYIDLRSDTVTNPTQKMREAMFNAVVGDDVYDDDPTIKELESLSAEILGKEAGLFVTSGTMGNQLAIFTHCKRGDEVILADDCHIVQHEVGGAAVISGVQLRTIISVKGEMPPKIIEEKIRSADEDIHYPGTELICAENAHSNGRVISLSNMEQIYKIGRSHNVPVHLDGARIFNAASFLNVDPKEISKYADTVTFCLSKGLCAPVGSVLVGSKEFINVARKKRKLLGGGIRQGGFLAAAGIVALNEMRDRLKDDHENALYLADKLLESGHYDLNKIDIHINMVFFKFKNKNIDGNKLFEHFLDKGIKINPPENGEMRFVTNYWIGKNEIDIVVKELNSFIEGN